MGYDWVSYLMGCPQVKVLYPDHRCFLASTLPGKNTDCVFLFFVYIWKKKETIMTFVTFCLLFASLEPRLTWIGQLSIPPSNWQRLRGPGVPVSLPLSSAALAKKPTPLLSPKTKKKQSVVDEKKKILRGRLSYSKEFGLDSSVLTHLLSPLSLTPPPSHSSPNFDKYQNTLLFSLLKRNFWPALSKIVFSAPSLPK